MELEQYQNIYNYLNTQQYPTTFSSQDRKRLQSQSQHFTISNNQLFKKARKPNKQFYLIMVLILKIK